MRRHACGKYKRTPLKIHTFNSGYHELFLILLQRKSIHCNAISLGEMNSKILKLWYQSLISVNTILNYDLVCLNGQNCTCQLLFSCFAKTRMKKNRKCSRIEFPFRQKHLYIYVLVAVDLSTTSSPTSPLLLCLELLNSH